VHTHARRTNHAPGADRDRWTHIHGTTTMHTIIEAAQTLDITSRRDDWLRLSTQRALHSVRPVSHQLITSKSILRQQCTAHMTAHCGSHDLNKPFITHTKRSKQETRGLRTTPDKRAQLQHRRSTLAEKELEEDVSRLPSKMRPSLSSPRSTHHLRRSKHSGQHMTVELQ